MADVGLWAQVACVWEATARKPGNVTRFHDFEDSTYLDFVLSAAAIGPVMATACQRKIGATVLEAVRATRQVVRTNTNLGIVLLLTPLAAVREGEELRSGVESHHLVGVPVPRRDHDDGHPGPGPDLLDELHAVAVR